MLDPVGRWCLKLIGVVNFDHRLVVRAWHLTVSRFLAELTGDGVSGQINQPLSHLRKMQREDEAFERPLVIPGTRRDQDFPLLRLRQCRFGR
jgi:hypothetical protein